ncbi:MAG: uridine monophosphate kinase [Candidatus Bipolaricaulis sp.]|nr:uridine monophosphate kinase [Candidatus Bipolaricaulis sp.]
MTPGPSRILLKLSGEALQGPEGAFSPDSLSRIAGEIAPLSSTQIAIVVGGGNVIRGARTEAFDRVEADTLGMLATVINALALRTYLEHAGRDVFVQSAIGTELTDPISPRDARKALSGGAIVVFAGGTGSPLVTTDTAAALRAVSIGADLLAKASNVPGVFDRDPAKDSSARRLSHVSFDEFLAARYGVMDQVAVEICREHRLPIEVFDFDRPGALRALTEGKRVGTRIGA